MTYAETIEYLFTRLPMYQRIGKVAYKKDLGNTIKLLEILGNPHEHFKSIHIAGTNGKGTSAHALASILQVAGYHTGLYTSPHLKSFTERIRIDGKEIPEDYVIDFVERIKSAIEQISPSFFEITVAMAFDYFSRSKVDIAVIETGLGGRLDSTNVIKPEVCLITNIGFDHMDLLGDTLEKIATEKAGIIKERVPVVIGTYQAETYPVFERTAKELNVSLKLASPSAIQLDELSPEYLTKNLGGVEAVVHELVSKGWNISQEQVELGVRQMNEQTGLKGRLQILGKNPLVIADVSHNVDGLKVLFDQIERLNRGTLHLVFGTVKDKDLKPLFSLFPANSRIYWVQSNVPRALSVDELAEAGNEAGLIGSSFTDVNDAIRQASENAAMEDLILITGSTFVVAEIDSL